MGKWSTDKSANNVKFHTHSGTRQRTYYSRGEAHDNKYTGTTKYDRTMIRQ